jgi:sugar phosphate isomerase/epimerase
MIGFTSRTFAGAIKRGETTLEELVAWAVDERFPWMEVRDMDLSLDEGALRKLAAAAAEGNMRLHYAWDGTNILDPADSRMFLRGVKNGTLFGPGTFVRLTIAGRVIRDDPARLGYSQVELATLQERIREYIQAASLHSVRPVFENSHEPLSGFGGEAGIKELLAGIPSMRLTFDPGNAMDREHNRSFCSAADIRKFYTDNRDRLPYVHVKMTKANIVQPAFVEDGDIEPAFYRGMLADGKLVCIELPEAGDLASCRRRVLDARRLLA